MYADLAAALLVTSKVAASMPDRASLRTVDDYETYIRRRVAAWKAANGH